MITLIILQSNQPTKMNIKYSINTYIGTATWSGTKREKKKYID